MSERRQADEPREREAGPEREDDAARAEDTDEARVQTPLQNIALLFAALWRLVRGQDQRGRKVRWMIGLLRPYRGRMVLMLGALLVETGAGLAPPFLAGRAIDAGIATGDLAALDWIVAAFVVVAIAYAAATYAETYLVGWVGTRALQDLRERIFVHIQGMSIGFFTR
ncbi:MAG: ABC transporter ATP-binding protein, partial [Actinobacteria bacterium]|nr:ABC transporter ATP-binding protein [Actinomycetota bacterium]